MRLSTKKVVILGINFILVTALLVMIGRAADAPPHALFVYFVALYVVPTAIVGRLWS